MLLSNGEVIMRTSHLFYVTNVTEQQQCQTEWKQMGNSVLPKFCIGSRTCYRAGSGDQTWQERGTNGYAAIGIFKRLWKTRALENKVQLWPILCCVIRIQMHVPMKFCH